MTVEDLKRILNSVKDDSAAVFIEYSPAQYEYITEYVTGVRYSDDGKLTILGITNHLSDEWGGRSLNFLKISGVKILEFYQHISTL